MVSDGHDASWEASSEASDDSNDHAADNATDDANDADAVIAVDDGLTRTASCGLVHVYDGDPDL